VSRRARVAAAGARDPHSRRGARAHHHGGDPAARLRSGTIPAGVVSGFITPLNRKNGRIDYRSRPQYARETKPPIHHQVPQIPQPVSPPRVGRSERRTPAPDLTVALHDLRP
jgi:hypothetical protein